MEYKGIRLNGGGIGSEKSTEHVSPIPTNLLVFKLVLWMVDATSTVLVLITLLGERKRELQRLNSTIFLY